MSAMTAREPDEITAQPRPALVIVAEPETRIVSEGERRLLLSRRQALLIELGGIEDYLGMERSVVPRHKRQ